VSVAVIIPVRNMADTLERAVTSAAGADEIHVIDDASDDNISEVMPRLPLRVTYWRWPVKSRCHLAAQRTVYEATKCRHIIGMGADDVLMPGFVDAVRKHADAPVIFTDYAVADNDGNVLDGVSQEVAEATTLTAKQMRARLCSDRNATESGIGSSLRSDVADWLWQHQWEVMGPHMDSIGYAAAAATFGCLLLPFVGAVYTYGRTSFGRDNMKTAEDFRRVGGICRHWLATVGMDDATTRALCLKRCHVTWS